MRSPSPRFRLGTLRRAVALKTSSALLAALASSVMCVGACEEDELPVECWLEVSASDPVCLHDCKCLPRPTPERPDVGTPRPTSANARQVDVCMAGPTPCGEWTCCEYGDGCGCFDVSTPGPCYGASAVPACNADGPTTGGGSGQKFCARSATSCRCSNQSFTLDSSEVAVADCDSPPAGSVCCFDLDASGKTTGCDCAAYACTPSDNDCECAWWWGRAAPVDAIGPEDCADDHAGSNTFPLPGICCDDGQTCQCEGAISPSSTQTCSHGAETTSCAGPSEPRDCSFFGANNLVGQAPASSCAGLSWK